MEDLMQRMAKLSPEKRKQLLGQLKNRSEKAIQSQMKSVESESLSFPLSFAQQRLWFFEQLIQGYPLYNLSIAAFIAGSLRVDILENSINDIIKRHASLRTSFTVVDGLPRQQIASSATLSLPVVDLRACNEHEQSCIISPLLQQIACLPFSLSSCPLLRIFLIHKREEEYILLLTMHHIISDAWSMEIFFQELHIIYNAYLHGTLPLLTMLDLQYPDYAVRQRSKLQGECLESLLRYWKKQLAGLPSVVGLPTDYPRPAVQAFRGAKQAFTLPQAHVQDLKALSKQHGGTLFMTLLTAFSILLCRYTGESEVVIGSPIANRMQTQLEHMIGFFVNLLVLRFSVSGYSTFAETFKRARETILDAYSYQELPFERLVEALQPERSSSYHPLVQIVCSMRSLARYPTQLGNLALHFDDVETGTAKFDLSLSFIETSEELQGIFTYDTALFKPATIQRLSNHLQKLLEGIVAHPEQSIRELPPLEEQELAVLLETWSGASTPSISAQCVHRIVEMQVRRMPDKVALVFRDEQVTYAELDRCSNQVVYLLQQSGIQPGAFIGLYMERSIEMIIGTLAILKLGCAYVPLDPAYPQARLSFMFSDACIQALLVRASEDIHHTLPKEMAVLCLDHAWSVLAHQDTPASTSIESVDQPAYIMYTSGSTGQPKGVIIPHVAITRLVCNTNYISFSASDSVVHASNTSFDAATLEIWGALLHGARLLIFPHDVTHDLPLFSRELKKHACDILFVTTAFFNLIANDMPQVFQGLRYLLFGGEAADPHAVRKVLQEVAPMYLINGYGPTESTTFAICNCIQEMSDEVQRVAIGRPIANTQAYVLDPLMSPTPIGVIGELYLGGVGLAHGYLHHADLTAEKFVPHPFSSKGGERLYKTGDLVRYTAEGSLEFIGRVDQQVKLRGFRIELGEIEATLSTHVAVDQAIVVLHEEPAGHKQLVAYVLTKNREMQPSDLSSYLKQRLPDYMVPTTFLFLENVPLTPNGKVNRHALPSPRHVGEPHNELPQEGGLTRPVLSTPFVLGRDQYEFFLTQIWEELLNIRPIGIKDNFFELGGHSLLAIQVLARAHQQFGKSLPLVSLIKEGTIEHLAMLLRKEGESEPWSPLLHIQRGNPAKPPLFFVHHPGGRALSYVNLARHLGAEYPVYAFQARGLEGQQEPHSSIEEMAADYVAALLDSQPLGPYFIAGYSFGGFIAFEMAQQLTKLGRKVMLLALLDTMNTEKVRQSWPHPSDDIGYWLWSFGRDIPLSREALNQLALEEQPEYIFEQLSKAHKLPAQYTHPNRRKFLIVEKSISQATFRYRPSPYSGSITLFRSSEQNRLSPEAPTLGWHALSNDVEVYEVSADHSHYLSKKVAVVAEQLRRCLLSKLQEGALGLR